MCCRSSMKIHISFVFRVCLRVAGQVNGHPGHHLQRCELSLVHFDGYDSHFTCQLCTKHEQNTHAHLHAHTVLRLSFRLTWRPFRVLSGAYRCDCTPHRQGKPLQRRSERLSRDVRERASKAGVKG